MRVIGHSISHFFPVRARSFRSLHRCESCTKKSCRCGRQALPGRISLSGNVPTEQPTLALTLCPFRGVLWREPCLSLSLLPSPCFCLVRAPSPSHSPVARRTPSRIRHRVFSLSFLPYAVSFSVPRLESLSGRTPPHQAILRPGSQYQPMWKPRRETSAMTCEVDRT